MELKLVMTAEEKAEFELLIVPYGIETRKGGNRYTGSATFNRTLWN